MTILFGDPTGNPKFHHAALAHLGDRFRRCVSAAVAPHC